MRKSILKVLACLMLCMSVGNVANADVVYTTNFNAPAYADGPLIGQDGWAITGASVVSPIQVGNTGTNGNVSLTTTGQDVNRTFTPNPIASLASIDYTADITVTAAQATGDYFMHLGDGGTANFWGRLYARSSAGGFQLALTTSSGTPAAASWGADLALGATVSINARYDIVTGLLNDTGQLLVNGNPYTLAQTIGTDAVGPFSSINLRQGATANAPTVTIDNIVVNVTAIPEPTSVAFLGLGFLGLVGVRRRV